MTSFFITNGTTIDKKLIDSLTSFSSVIRVSFNGGSRDDYLTAHRRDHFYLAIKNMKEMARQRKAKGREKSLLLGSTFILPATLNMMPFSKELKNTTKAILPDNTMNFLPETEFKVWPKKSSRLSDRVDTVIPKTDHDNIFNNQIFVDRVAEFIKTCM